MPYGSPSSRFPRSPMWPLDRAKSDSDCASRSRSSVVSLTDHGSTGYGRCTITCGPRGRPGPAPRCRHRARAARLPGPSGPRRRRSRSGRPGQCAVFEDALSGAGLPARCSSRIVTPPTCTSTRDTSPVTASTSPVLAVTGLVSLVEVQVDGVTIRDEHLAGKPAPDTFLAAAKRLGSQPGQCAVFEDALSGVEAGRAGHFGYVVGVDRMGQADELLAHGADTVVQDLADLLDRT